MSCILSFVGHDMDADLLLQQTGLPFTNIKRKGEPRYTEKPEGHIMTYTVVSMEVSNAPFSDFNAQVADTIHFLHTYEQQLMRTILVPGIEHKTIDFGVDYRPEQPTTTFYLKHELIALAAKCGLAIEISTYNEDFFS